MLLRFVVDFTFFSGFPWILLRYNTGTVVPVAASHHLHLLSFVTQPRVTNDVNDSPFTLGMDVPYRVVILIQAVQFSLSSVPGNSQKITFRVLSLKGTYSIFLCKLFFKFFLRIGRPHQVVHQLSIFTLQTCVYATQWHFDYCTPWLGVFPNHFPLFCFQIPGFQRIGFTFITAAVT